MKYDDKEGQKISAVREPPLGFDSATNMKRLTIDISVDLHSAIKVECARRGIMMSDAIRDILNEKFGKVE